MANLVNKQAIDENLSLIELMEKVLVEDQNGRPAKTKTKMSNNPIVDQLHTINTKKQKQVIKPIFEPQKIVIEKKNVAKNSQKQTFNLPFQHSSSSVIRKPTQKEQRTNQIPIRIPLAKPIIFDSIKSSKNQQQGKANLPNENRQLPTKIEKSPSKITHYPITFHQSMVYKGTQLNISLGAYKHYYSNWKQKCAMVVFFSEVNEVNDQVSFFLDLQGQQGCSFLKQIEQSEKYNYLRTGEVKVYNKRNSSYDKIYFIKTPNKNVQAHLFSNEIELSIIKLVQIAASHEIQCLQLSWLRWGRVKSKQCARQILNGVVKTIKSLGTKKTLKIIRICLKNLPQYDTFSELFRQLCDEYMKTFYQ